MSLMTTQAVFFIHGRMHHGAGQPIFNLHMALAAKLESCAAKLPGMIRSVGMMTSSTIPR
jgi:hypothetical protein